MVTLKLHFFPKSNSLAVPFKYLFCRNAIKNRDGVDSVNELSFNQSQTKR